MRDLVPVRRRPIVELDHGNALRLGRRSDLAATMARPRRRGKRTPSSRASSPAMTWLGIGGAHRLAHDRDAGSAGREHAAALPASMPPSARSGIGAAAIAASAVEAERRAISGLAGAVRKIGLSVA